MRPSRPERPGESLSLPPSLPPLSPLSSALALSFSHVLQIYAYALACLRARAFTRNPEQGKQGGQRIGLQQSNCLDLSNWITTIQSFEHRLLAGTQSRHHGHSGDGDVHCSQRRLRVTGSAPAPAPDHHHGGLVAAHRCGRARPPRLRNAFPSRTVKR